MATEGVQMPQVEILNRVLGYPLVELALAKSASTYSRVKDSHQFLHWILTTAETSLTNATKQAVPLAVPIAKKFETPIHFVDHKLCLGLDKIEKTMPVVKETPGQMLENAYMLALDTVRPAVSTISHVNDLIYYQAANWKDQSWNKINQILDTQYGTAAVHGLDSTAIMVDQLIEKYFPPVNNENAVNSKNVVIVDPSEKDKLLHTLQTVGRLSHKAACRVYINIIHHLNSMKKENLKIYVSSVVEFLQLTRYLHAINERVQHFTSTDKNHKKQENNCHEQMNNDIHEKSA